MQLKVCGPIVGTLDFIHILAVGSEWESSQWEEVYGRWNELLASREATSLTTVLKIAMDLMDEPLTMYTDMCN